MTGTLYIVATPIGNLGDMSLRAVETLKNVDFVLTEDTRHSQHLLNHYGIKKPLFALHAHNENHMAPIFLERLQADQSAAFISDAGTPLISDPGYLLCRGAHAVGIRVVPIPGPSAITTALSLGLLPCNRFAFEGFLSPKSSSRLRQLKALRPETRTMVFYEAPHRVLNALEDMLTVFGANRRIVLARELTKKFETYECGFLADIHHKIGSQMQALKGEIVLLVAGTEGPRLEAGEPAFSPEIEKHLHILIKALPLKQACVLLAEMHGLRKNALYEWALKSLI